MNECTYDIYIPFFHILILHSLKYLNIQSNIGPRTLKQKPHESAGQKNLRLHNNSSLQTKNIRPNISSSESHEFGVELFWNTVFTACKHMSSWSSHVMLLLGWAIGTGSFSFLKATMKWPDRVPSPQARGFDSSRGNSCFPWGCLAELESQPQTTTPASLQPANSRRWFNLKESKSIPV